MELDWLKKWSLYSPEKCALFCADTHREFSYREFFNISVNLANFLEARGVQKGTRVAVLAENQIEYVFLFFALQRMGAILVPINFRLTTPEAQFIVDNCDCEFLVSSQDYASIEQSIKVPNRLAFKEIEENIDDWSRASGEYPFVGEFEKGCLILHTSGTTGNPKGVVITPKILFWNSVNTNLSMSLSPEDV
ncbi:MAG: AMP-binding protein, partial [Pseudomonadota bacterium]